VDLVKPDKLRSEKSRAAVLAQPEQLLRLAWAA
jgi:hypothetical protein